MLVAKNMRDKLAGSALADWMVALVLAGKSVYAQGEYRAYERLQLCWLVRGKIICCAMSI